MISVVIPTFNGKHILETTLPGNIAYFEEYGMQVIIVDDCSSDDTVSWLTSAYPTFKVIKTPVNGGFSKTMNLGIAEARFPFVLMLNNDMSIQQFNLEALAGYCAMPSLFSVTPQILRPEQGFHNESITTGYFKGGWLTTKSGAIDPSTVSEGAPILWGCGGGMFVNTEKLRELGGFDTVYSPFYCEDLDLSYRAWKHGWKNLYSSEIGTFHHQHQATIGTMFSKKLVQRIYRRNYYLFLLRNITYPAWRFSLMVTFLIKILTFQLNDVEAMLNALLLNRRFPRRSFVEHWSDPAILDRITR